MARSEGDARALDSALALVRSDREHGASWLAGQAARALADATGPMMGLPTELMAAESAERRLGEIHAAAHAFATARPSMAVLANTVAAIWWAGRRGDVAARLRAQHAEALRLLAAREGAVDAILGHVRPLLGEVVYTHSRSGTVEAALRRLAEEGRVRHILTGESRPGAEGIALARSLAGCGARVTLVADAACGAFVGQAGAVLLGADSVRADGSLVNKVGSYPLALAAREASVPVYVLCESLKIAAPAYPLVFEERDPDDLNGAPLAGVEVRTIVFEYTPAALLAGVIAEDGPLAVGEIGRRAAAAGMVLAALLDEAAPRRMR